MTDMTHTLDALIALAAGDDGLPDDMRADVERLRARLSRSAVPAELAEREFAADRQSPGEPEHTLCGLTDLAGQMQPRLERIAPEILKQRAERARAAEQHPDDAAVDRFAQAMKAKLAQARAKGRSGWDDPAQCSPEYLADLLAGHVRKGNDGNFVDVANFAMMLHQRGAAPSVMPDAIRRSAAEESSADAGEPRRFETPQEFVQWLRSVRAYGSDAEDTWGAAEVAAQAVEGMLEQRQLRPNCGSDIVYEDRVDQGKGVKHCDDCGHEFPNPVYVEQEQPEDGPVAWLVDYGDGSDPEVYVGERPPGVAAECSVAPLYPEAVKAECERLREKLAETKEQSETRWAGYVRESNLRREIEAERDALQRENAELRERVKELVEIIGDIKRWDISNLLLDIPHPLRKRMQAVLAAMQEGKS